MARPPGNDPRSPLRANPRARAEPVDRDQDWDDDRDDRAAAEAKAKLPKLPAGSNNLAPKSGVAIAKAPIKVPEIAEPSAKIVIAPGPMAPVPEPVVAKPARRAIEQPSPPKSRGLGLVITVYILATAALGFAIYERFVA